MARKFSGRQLRRLRVEAGFRPERLALETDRSTYSINGYEMGRIQPPLEVAARLAGVLGVTVDELLVEDDERVSAGAA